MQIQNYTFEKNENRAIMENMIHEEENQGM